MDLRISGFCPTGVQHQQVDCPSPMLLGHLSSEFPLRTLCATLIRPLSHAVKRTFTNNFISPPLVQSARVIYHRRHLFGSSHPTALGHPTES